MPTEAQIHADVETLRAQASDTQDLYREVCTILFFRYGITPTANKLYQYVRKGSMSAPAEALAKFWGDLREKSRVRIEHPDLPENLKSAAGELVAALWTHAQSAAQESLEILRSEAKGEVLEARTAKALAENERFVALLELDQAKQATAAASEHQLQLERDLAAERATSAALTSQLETIQRQQTVLEAALAEARRDFAAELEMHRKAQGLSQERYEATEKRALTEIDRERTSAAKLQKELAQSRQSQQEAEARHRSEVAQLQADLDSAHQKSGMAEGMLLELRTRYQQQTEESKLLRTTVAEHETEKGLLKYELAACRENVAKLERQLQEWMAAATPERQVRKTHQKNSKKGRIAELL